MASFVQREQGSNHVTWGQTVAKAGVASGLTLAGVAVGGMLNIPVLDEIYEGSIKAAENLTGFGSAPDTPESFMDVIGDDFRYNLTEANSTVKWLADGAKSTGEALAKGGKAFVETAYDNSIPGQLHEFVNETVADHKLMEAAEVLSDKPPITINGAPETLMDSATKETIAANRESVADFAVRLKEEFSSEQIATLADRFERANLLTLEGMDIDEATKEKFAEQIKNFDFTQMGQDIIDSDSAGDVREELARGTLGDHFKGGFGSFVTNNAMLGGGLGLAGLGYAHLNHNPIRQQAVQQLGTEAVPAGEADMSFAAKEQSRAMKALMQARMDTFGAQQPGPGIA